MVTEQIENKNEEIQELLEALRIVVAPYANGPVSSSAFFNGVRGSDALITLVYNNTPKKQLYHFIATCLSILPTFVPGQHDLAYQRNWFLSSPPTVGCALPE